MSLLHLVGYFSDEETFSNEIPTRNQDSPNKNSCNFVNKETKSIDVDTKSIDVDTKSTSHIHLVGVDTEQEIPISDDGNVVVEKSERSEVSISSQLPSPPTAPPDPQLVDKIKEYLRLRDSNGFDLTEVRYAIFNSEMFCILLLLG